MIQIGSKLQVVDNSGGKWGKCLLIKKKGKYVTAGVGMLILLSLKKFSSWKKVNKRTIYLGLIVGICCWIKRFNGVYIKFFSNRLILFNKQFKFLGTRIYGGVLKELKIFASKGKKTKSFFLKIFSYSSFIV